MSKLTVPNNIVDGTLIEASAHQQNYQSIESFVNDQVIHADGSVAMDAGSELLLGKAATTAQGAVTKAQLDNAVDAAVGGGFLPLSGGTLTGRLIAWGQDVSGPGAGGLLVGFTGTSSTHIAIDGNEIQAYSDGKPSSLNLNIEGTGSKGPVSVGGDLLVGGSLKVDGKEVYTKAKAGDQVYTKKEIDDLLAARPLMKMCDKPTRVYDQRGGLKALTWYKIQLPSTVGGVARSGAKAAYVNMTTVVAAKDRWVAVRPDGSNWNPNDPSAQYSTMNITAGEVDNEHCLMAIGSNGAIQFWVHGTSPSDTAVDGLVLDVIALVF